MPSEHSRIVGQRINAAIALRNVKQKDLAEFLGIIPNTVSYWLKGERTPNTEQIAKISQYLDVSSDYLLGLSAIPSNKPDKKVVSRTTGLDENSILSLVELMMDNPGKTDIINLMIGSDRDSFSTMIDDIYEARRGYIYFQQYREMEKALEQLNDTEKDEILSAYHEYITLNYFNKFGYIPVNHQTLDEALYSQVNTCKYMASENFSDIVNRIIHNYMHKDINFPIINDGICETLELKSNNQDRENGDSTETIRHFSDLLKEATYGKHNPTQK